MLFNLLPALPLDGGRVLCALLSPHWGTERAVRVGVWIGRALAGLMALAAVWGLFKGRINLTLAFGALYLGVSANREKLQASGAAPVSYTHLEHTDRHGGQAGLERSGKRRALPAFEPRHRHQGYSGFYL